MNRCGCNPIPEPFEYRLQNPPVNIKRKFGELFPIEPNIEELKDKLICEFEDILNKLECGIPIEDLEFLLQDLSWIYIKEKIFEDMDSLYTPPITYIGFGSENINDLNIGLFIKRYQEHIRMEETVQNEIFGNHLWIISPFALHKVATDKNFTFEVKMNPVAYKDGLHYYRSNSKVDVCNLTYYIK